MISIQMYEFSSNMWDFIRVFNHFRTSFRAYIDHDGLLKLLLNVLVSFEKSIFLSMQPDCLNETTDSSDTCWLFHLNVNYVLIIYLSLYCWYKGQEKYQWTPKRVIFTYVDIMFINRSGGLKTSGEGIRVHRRRRGEEGISGVTLSLYSVSLEYEHTFFTETYTHQLTPNILRLVRTSKYVDPVELWYLKMQDRTVILQSICFSNALTNRWLHLPKG